MHWENVFLSESGPCMTFCLFRFGKRDRPCALHNIENREFALITRDHCANGASTRARFGLHTMLWRRFSIRCPRSPGDCQDICGPPARAISDCLDSPGLPR
jgi:hypothetical protein